MRNFLNSYFGKVVKATFLVTVYLFSLGASDDSEKKNKKRSLSKVQIGEFFVFDFNNLYIPIDNKGVIAAVDADDGIGPGGMFDNQKFLHSSGFYISGYANGELFGNGVLSSSRVDDYQPGTVGSDKTDSKNIIYVVSIQDAPFGNSWLKWKTAVEIGADFYDGNGDGVYNPIDLNGNNKWDENEDRPDILGDVTAWCVYNDGVDDSLRRFSVIPKGIEIHQTVFVLKEKGTVGNIMFVRYRIKNSGTIADSLTNLYFAIAADPDLGDHSDDLVGCDIDLSAGYVYNKTPDAKFGEDCPSFLMTILQGPHVYILNETFTDIDGDGKYTDGVDTPIDTAFAFKGKKIGIDIYPGAKNLPLTSMTQYMSSNATQSDPDTHFELRNYMVGGKSRIGDSIYVSVLRFGNGADLGSDTTNISAHYMYSGEPELQTGWLNTLPYDQRQMCNTGPFNLAKGEYQDIYAAYVVGRGTTSLNSVSITKELAKVAIGYYNTNFESVVVGIDNKPKKTFPTKYSLSQNYPNPFNPSTKIKYSIPSYQTSSILVKGRTEEEFVSLKVFDILGREITTLVNEVKQPGNYEVQFDANSADGGLTSGMYFYELTSGNFRTVKKMILLK